jgi:hypothetical protein
MERTLLSWSIPNIISVWLMAAVGFLIAGIIWQLVLRAQGGGGGGGQAATPDVGNLMAAE